MSLYEKMFNVMNESEAIEKSMTVGTGKNAYQAVSEASMLNMVKPLFKKYKLIIFPISGDIQEIVNVYNKTDYDNKTTESQRAITQIKVTFRILDIETNEFQDIIGFGNGADSQDKGAGKAYTYSLKNSLSKTFMLFSGEDTDNDHSDDIGKKETKKDIKPPVLNNESKNDSKALKCEDCQNEITKTATKSVQDLIDGSQKYYKKNLCSKCTGVRYRQAHPGA